MAEDQARSTGSVFRRIVVGVAVLSVAVAASAGWANRGYVDAYLSTSDRIPAATEAATTVPDDAGPMVRLAVAGDAGTGGPAAYATTAAMDVLDRQHDFDALLLLGDNIYANGDPTQIDATVFEPFATVLDNGTQLLAVLGNHDVDAGNGPAQAAALGMPGPWYSTVIGDAEIVALDSNQSANVDQLAWLEETLRTSQSRWVIAIMHHPAYSGGWHGSTAGVQEDFVPLFERYGVDLALAGHDHDYQRTEPINGITYVVTGAASKLRPTGVESFSEVAYSVHSFVDLSIYPDRIALQAIDHEGRAIDQFTLTGT